MSIIRDLFKFDTKFRFGSILIFIILLMVLLSFFSPYGPEEMRVVRRNLPPDSSHILGTNAQGQDVFWRLTYAIRNSLLIGLLSACISRGIGMVNGLISGYLGGRTDRILSTITDSFIVIPKLPLLILVSFIFKDVMNFFIIALIIGLLDWAWPSKRYRAQILTLRERGFTNTAVFSGMKTPKIVYKEHFPFLIPYMMADIISGFVYAIGMEITLSVLGLTSLSTPTIGTMIYWARYYQSMLLGRWWWLLSPVVATVMTVLGLYLLSNSISTFLDPRTRLKRIKVGAANE